MPPAARASQDHHASEAPDGQKTRRPEGQPGQEQEAPGRVRYSTGSGTRHIDGARRDNKVQFNQRDGNLCACMAMARRSMNGRPPRARVCISMRCGQLCPLLRVTRCGAVRERPPAAGSSRVGRAPVHALDTSDQKLNPQSTKVSLFAFRLAVLQRCCARFSAPRGRHRRRWTLPRALALGGLARPAPRKPVYSCRLGRSRASECVLAHALSALSAQTAAACTASCASVLRVADDDMPHGQACGAGVQFMSRSHFRVRFPRSSFYLLCLLLMPLSA